MLKKIYIALVSLALPTVLFAQEGGNLVNFGEKVKEFVDLLIPIAFGLAIAAFFFGVAKFLFTSGDGKEDGKRIMLYGTLAIVIMLSIFGIAQFFQNSLGIENNSDAKQYVPSISSS